MEDKNKYGILLTKDIKLFRQYFREMVKLLGIYVLYRAPKENTKNYTLTGGDIEAEYEEPIQVGCIFEEHPTQQTLRKIGWVSELQENASIIYVDYDLPNLQQGALFLIPSGLDNAKDRLFRVVSLRNSIVYPSSIECEIVPEYEDTVDKETAYDFTENDFTLLTNTDQDYPIPNEG